MCKNVVLFNLVFFDFTIITIVILINISLTMQNIFSLSCAGTAGDSDIPPVSDGQLGLVPGVQVEEVQAGVEGGGAAGAGPGRGSQH